MKIAYIAHTHLNRETGVIKKIASQLHAWNNAGNEARLFSLSPNNNIWKGFEDTKIVIIRSGGTINRLFNYQILVDRVIDWQPDVVYIRHTAKYRPPLGKLLKIFPTFVEINTDDVQEFSSSLSKFWYTYHLATRDFLLKNVCGMVIVSQELANRFSKYKKPTTVIGNGINLSLYPSLPAPNNPNPKFVFIGSPGYPWHGLEKILFLALNFKQWNFDLIGIGKDDIDGAIPNNVSAHGELNSESYESIMLNSDIALGTLSLHKKKMNEASPLKVREYLAYGIPTIIGHQETDFPIPPPFLLQIPNTPNNVEMHLTEIAAFTKAWKGKRIEREKISHLDVTIKESKKIAFFKEVMSKRK